MVIAKPGRTSLPLAEFGSLVFVLVSDGRIRNRQVTERHCESASLTGKCALVCGATWLAGQLHT